jgi:hypothetical protein
MKHLRAEQTDWLDNGNVVKRNWKMKFLSVEHKGWPDYRNMSNVDMKTNLLRLERYD